MCKRDTPGSSNLGLVAHPKAVSLVALLCSWTDEECPRESKAVGTTS